MKDIYVLHAVTLVNIIIYVTLNSHDLAFGFNSDPNSGASEGPWQPKKTSVSRMGKH